MSVSLRKCLVVWVWLLSPWQFIHAQEITDAQLLEFLVVTCHGSNETAEYWPENLAQVGPSHGSIEIRGTRVGERFIYLLGDGSSLRMDLLRPPNRPARYVLEFSIQNKMPELFIGMDANCKVRQARRLNYRDGKAYSLDTLDQFLDSINSELLNPPVPQPAGAEINPGDSVVQRPQLLVAMVDSGVNYQLPEINQRLARDSKGQLLGYDFWDMDPLPFDAHPAASPFFIQRHGTQTASLMLREVSDIQLVSYRYPRSDLSRMKLLIEHARSIGIRIVGLPLGSNNSKSWAAFEVAAKAHPDILFIVSAGNNGRDIDARPVFPASLTIDNMITVTSSNDYLRPAERTNWGKESVDFMLPAEQQRVLNFNGDEAEASGSSYAVSRMVALAADFLNRRKTLDTPGLIKSLRQLAIPPANGSYVKIGYIPDPVANSKDLIVVPGSKMMLAEPASPPRFSTSLSGVMLDQEWSIQDIQSALTEVNSILSQCDIGFSSISFVSLNGPDYLRDLATGSAHTLMAGLTDLEINPGYSGKLIKVLFARDSQMQIKYDAEAFGVGNTRARPWLINSVWVMQGAKDLGVTLAHELFHVLANNGDHVPRNKNLMSADTNPANTALTPGQCALARGYFSRK